MKKSIIPARRRAVCGLVVTLAVLALVSGCKTPPERPPPPPIPQAPLTISILRRLGEALGSLEGNVGRFQLALSGRIVMEREYSVRNDTFGEGDLPKFEDRHIKEVITVHDQTEGLALEMEIAGGRFTLSICFEANDEHKLFFSCPEAEPESLFYLVYTPAVAGEPPGGGEKGSLGYAGNTYKLFTSEAQPYLLINLSQRDIDILNSRVAPGRRARAAPAE